MFISTCIIERAWETFKTSKETRREELHGDWTLAAVTGAYLVLFFLLIAEFYFTVESVNVYFTITGFLLLGLSFRLRFWGMAALGKQWAVHAMGAKKIRKVRIIKLGPYRYIRHPIYLGIMIECIAFVIIANAFYSLFFALFVCVPLVIIRALLEEKASLRRFGERYDDYKKRLACSSPCNYLETSTRAKNDIREETGTA